MIYLHKKSGEICRLFKVDEDGAFLVETNILMDEGFNSSVLWLGHSSFNDTEVAQMGNDRYFMWVRKGELKKIKSTVLDAIYGEVK